MNLRHALRVPPGRGVDLSQIDPDSTPGLPKAEGKKTKGKRKAWARARLDDIGAEMAVLQEKLFATVKTTGSGTRLLLVLQATDCGGKDGTIKNVAGVMNPQGLQIVAFGKPTAEELAHDFLWRIRKALPGPGHVGVFNRSHYEDVLVVRVNGLVPKRTWQARYAKINKFEQELAGSGCVVVKVMLHISKDEQARRLGERLQDPAKYWKYDPGDIDERGKWDDYQQAYTDLLERCSTEIAPWYVVPANRKWYRNWAIATILRDTMADMDLAYPPPGFDLATERARLVADASTKDE